MPMGRRRGCHHTAGAAALSSALPSFRTWALVASFLVLRYPCPALAGICLTVKMYDSWGDGWGDGKWTWYATITGPIVTGNLKTGASDTAQICNVDPGCYTFEVYLGEFSSEVSYSVSSSADASEVYVGLTEGGNSWTNTHEICVLARPTLSPSLSPVPTATYTPTGTTVAEVRDYGELVGSLASGVTNLTIDVVADIVVLETIDIIGMQGLVIRSSVNATISGGSAVQIMHIRYSEVRIEYLTLEDGFINLMDKDGAAGDGGCLSAILSTVDIKYATFRRCNANDDGGALYIEESTLIVGYSLFQDNTANVRFSRHPSPPIAPHRRRAPLLPLPPIIPIPPSPPSSMGEQLTRFIVTPSSATQSSETTKHTRLVPTPSERELLLHSSHNSEHI